jgi:hypothetical protein
MRFRVVPITVLLLILVTLPAFAQWQWGRPHPPQAGACFYKDSEFRGDFFCLKVGERWPSLPAGFNDKISSIRVFGGARARVFTDDRFGGPNQLIDHDVNDLRRIPIADSRFRNKNWNDRISSLAVFVRERDEWGDHRPSR